MMYAKREGSAKGTPRPPLLRPLPPEVRETSFVEPPWYPGRLMWAHDGFSTSTLQGGAHSGDTTVRGGRSRGATEGGNREQANGDRRERGEGGGGVK
jgi:hypothetical protein